ncbi:endonuclease/exonuclease/phosphatase family protein [Yinghuangia aomiensis]
MGPLRRRAPDTARRRPALLDALRAADADVIALQEVEADLVTLLAAAPWVRAAYTLTTDPGRPPGRGRHRPPAAQPRPRPRDRRTGAGPAQGRPRDHRRRTVRTPGRRHHPPDQQPHGERKARRNEELTVLAEALADVEGEAVLLGDFNDGTDLPAVSLGMRDAWTEVRGPADGTPTFDPGANPLAALSSLTGRAQRLDRVLLREVGGSGPGAGLHPASAELVGDAPGDDGLFVSDHYGVAVALVPADVAAGSVLDAPPTARTAVAVAAAGRGAVGRSRTCAPRTTRRSTAGRRT